MSYINSSSLAKSFGLVKEDAMNPSLNVVLDIFAIVFAVTAGVHWNFSKSRSCCVYGGAKAPLGAGGGDGLC